jgi:processive 1,2-diacylglycerol beta-glucosyltransferase
MSKHSANRCESAPTPHEPRILILSTSVGAGHIRAAQALALTFKDRLPQTTVEHVDVLELTNAAFRKGYRDGYFSLVKHAPNVVGMLYDKLDKPNPKNLGTQARLSFERTNFGKLSKLLRQEPSWDLVVSTHFLPPQMIAHLRKKERIHCPQVIVVTDYDVQGMWLHEPCEAYFVSNPEAKVYLDKLGIDPQIVHATGIPIDPVFTKSKDRNECRRELGFNVNRPLILQMSGGLGIGPAEQIYRSLREDVTVPAQICVVAGKNTKLKSALEAHGPDSRHDCKVMGFTDKVDELMAAADMVITKPGGLTTSEALARGCPIVIIDPIPGQEERNSDFLLENGCAIKPSHPEKTLGYRVNELLKHPARLHQMQKSARRCSHPEAARDVVDQCIALLHARGVSQSQEKLSDAEESASAQRRRRMKLQSLCSTGRRKK